MVDKRAVGFLDILGFKNLIETTPLDELATHYEQLIAQARAYVRPTALDGDHPTLFPNRPNRIPWCTQHIFSDSIILVANDDTDAGCLELLLYTWRLEQMFLAAGMPLRGAVDYGEMYSNANSGVFLGTALSTAYRSEMEQDWIGICINEPVAERYTELFGHIRNEQNLLSEIFKLYPIPLKNGATKRLHTVNWRYNYIVEKGTRSLFQSNSDPSVQRKQKNTLAYAREIVDGGKIYSQDQEALPVELRAFWVGGKEPPFPHGDEL